MRLRNSDLDEGDRGGGGAEFDENEFESEDGPVESFFDLRQRTLVGLDSACAFRIVAPSLLRKLRENKRGTLLYAEVEDALGRYFRLLDADMQKFANLHETLGEAVAKYESGTSTAAANSAEAAASNSASTRSKSLGGNNGSPVAVKAARAILVEAMREIAVVLLACGEMQRRALELKMTTQRAMAESNDGVIAYVSFTKCVDFFEEALHFCDSLRKKHEELHHQRMRAMATAAEARVASSASGGGSGGSSAAASPAPPASGSDAVSSVMAAGKATFKPSPRARVEGLMV
eukprot:CAMPEP_0206534066 /NCGR_PEP_ID=MMETSP0325_2-20121206/5330_1 /ASSEMBLY_ACC=CAM_ASM_000347 /TAXON_ID=2866 /ORGANISM="Crypthecodinium cohnii, Strain Seligo" /LENGTH=289 /DNA_ID=CAMNT_0054030811 /DNA_START=101 /DNA_END=970 /DNA_ORIENTATION=-